MYTFVVPAPVETMIATLETSLQMVYITAVWKVYDYAILVFTEADTECSLLYKYRQAKQIKPHH